MTRKVFSHGVKEVDMPIYYRSLTRPYREVCLKRLEQEVQRVEEKLRCYRLELIDWSELAKAWLEHRVKWSHVTVQQVFDSDLETSNHAQDVVNRNEMLFRYLDYMLAEFETCELYDEWLIQSRENRIQFYLDHVVLRQSYGFDLPPLS